MDYLLTYFPRSAFGMLVLQLLESHLKWKKKLVRGVQKNTSWHCTVSYWWDHLPALTIAANCMMSRRNILGKPTIQLAVSLAATVLEPQPLYDWYKFCYTWRCSEIGLVWPSSLISPVTSSMEWPDCAPWTLIAGRRYLAAELHRCIEWCTREPYDCGLGTVSMTWSGDFD